MKSIDIEMVRRILGETGFIISKETTGDFKFRIYANHSNGLGLTVVNYHEKPNVLHVYIKKGEEFTHPVNAPFNGSATVDLEKIEIFKTLAEATANGWFNIAA